MPLNNYLLEVNVENLTDTIMFVTTENFKIKNLVTGDYLSAKDTRAIFPPDDQTGYFIDFVRLRPRISDEIPGEKINLTCEFSISTAKVDGMFNVVSTCSYGYSVDDVKMETKKDNLKFNKKTEEVIENIYTKQYKLPEFTEDKKTIRKLIADKPFGVKDTISINYILSDNYIHDYLLSKEPGELLNLFPRELGYLLSVSSNQIMVNLYYSNANKLFDEKSLKKTIEFFNKDDFKLLNYKLIKI
jgi:hypothetical protein